MAMTWEGGGGVKVLTDRGPFGLDTFRPGAMQAIGQGLQGAFTALGNFGAGLGAAGQGYMQGLGQQGNAYADAYKGYAGGLSGLGQSASQGLGYLGQGLTGLGNAQAGAYGAYSQGLGSVANSIGQERSNFYNSNSVAEAARQAALGNIGTASLSAYGGAANNAMSAWAQNQLAYNQALAGLGTANQAGLSQLGQSRNAALGNLGGAYADLGGKLGAASVLGNLNFNMSDGGMGGSGGFNATGPNGEIASGSYGGGGGGFSASGSRVSDASQLQDISAPAYAGLGGLQSNLMASDISDSMNRNYTDGMNRLDAQHYSSRGMPSQMLGQTLSGLLSLGRDAYGQVRGGMDQFYATQNDPRNRGDYSGILQALGAGYGTVRSDLNQSRGDLMAGYRDTSDRLDRYSDQMKAGYGAANQNIGGVLGALSSGFQNVAGSMQDMFNSGVDKLFGPNALEQAKINRATDLFNKRSALEDQAWAWENSPINNEWSRKIAADRRQKAATMPLGFGTNVYV